MVIFDGISPAGIILYIRIVHRFVFYRHIGERSGINYLPPYTVICCFEWWISKCHFSVYREMTIGIDCLRTGGCLRLGIKKGTTLITRNNIPIVIYQMRVVRHLIQYQSFLSVMSPAPNRFVIYSDFLINQIPICPLGI